VPNLKKNALWHNSCDSSLLKSAISQLFAMDGLVQAGPHVFLQLPNGNRPLLPERDLKDFNWHKLENLVIKSADCGSTFGLPPEVYLEE
jgi:hypothetical protein